MKDARGLGSKLVGRLEIGAFVTSEEVRGHRMRYRKASGTGPDAGWVSAELLAQVLDASRVKVGQPPAALNCSSAIAVAEARVLKEGPEAARAAASQGKDLSSLLVVAIAHLTKGAGEKALEAALAALAAAQEARSKDGEASALLAVAASRLSREEPKLAVDSAVRALELFRALDDKQMTASALATMANARLASGEAILAVALAKEALALFQSIGDKDGEAAAELTLTEALIARDGLEKGEGSVAKDKASRAKQRGDRPGEIQALLDLATSHADADGKEAMQLAKQAVELAKQLGDSRMEVSALVQLATLQSRDQSTLDDALATAGEALTASTSSGDRSAQAAAATTIARAQGQKGEGPVALDSIARALTLSQEVGDKRAEACACQVAADLHFAQADWPAAEQSVKKSIAIYEELGDHHGKARALQLGAKVHLGQSGGHGQMPIEAARLAKQALAIFRLLGDVRGEASTWQMVASMHLRARGGVHEAAMAAERARSAFLLLGDKKRQGLAAHTVAQCNLQLGEVDLCLQAAMQAVVLAQKTRDPWGEASALHTAAHAVLRKGRLAEGLRMATEVQSLFSKLGCTELEKAAKSMVTHIQEVLPGHVSVPRLHVEVAESVLRLGSDHRTISSELANCIVWNTPTSSLTYVVYSLELLKLVDDLKNQVNNTTVIAVTQGVWARQTGQELPGNLYSCGAAVIWATCRTIRLESPKLHLCCVDIPLGATCNEIAECLRSAQSNSGPRDELAFFIDRRNKLKANKK